MMKPLVKYTFYNQTIRSRGLFFNYKITWIYVSMLLFKMALKILVYISENGHLPSEFSGPAAVKSVFIRF